MEYRLLGQSGLKVPVLSLGTATFGGVGELFARLGSTGVEEASRMVDICLEAGMNFFDTADVYSSGVAEEILGKALRGRRDRVLISTKGTFATGQNPNAMGSSRQYLLRSVDNSLRRLQTDYIDIYFLHTFDALTPMEETMGVLDELVKAGKIRYTGISNFSGWHIMKSIAVAEKYQINRHVCHQAYYSLIGREYEWELMPLALDQGLATMVWSPLGSGRLTGKIRRAQPVAEGRSSSKGIGDPKVENETLYRIIDVLDELAEETGKTVPQVALNWLLSRPSVANVVVGARNEKQLQHNIGASEFKLSAEQIAKLDAVSHRPPIYPYWHQCFFDERNPKPTSWSSD